MAISKAFSNYINFIGGLDTEASVLNRNPTSVTDIDNCIINDKGEIESRGGVEALVEPIPTTDNYDPPYFNQQIWNWECYKNGNKYNFQIIKNGDYLYFYEGNLSQLPNLNIKANSHIPYLYNTYLSLSFNEASIYHINMEEVRVNLRKIYIDDSGSIQKLTSPCLHRKNYEFIAYDAYASDTKFKIYAPDVTDILDVLDAGDLIQINFNDNTTKHTTVFSVVADGVDYYEVTVNDTIDFANIKSINVSNIETILSTILDNVASTFALGRFIFGGLDRFPNRVFYSQIKSINSLEDDFVETKFYQVANPYDPNDSSVVPTDGGYFDIKGAGKIINIEELAGSLIIFCDNGIWSASGSDGIFRNDDYIVSKITDDGCISKASVAKIDGSIVYASESGINVIYRDSNYETFKIVSLSDAKIKTLYVSLDYNTKNKIKTTYDPIGKQIYFLYSNTHRYSNILIYNLKNKNWVKWSLSGVGITIGHIYKTKVYNMVESNLTTDSGDTILTDLGETVTILEQSNNIEQTVLGAIYSYYDENNMLWYTFGKLQTDNILDFKGTSKEEFNQSYLISAHQTYGDTLRKKNSNYIKVIFEVIEDGVTIDENGFYNPLGECKLQVSYDFANNPVYILDEFNNFKQSNIKYGKTQTAYPKYKNLKSISGDLTLGYSHVSNKIKVLGRGSILQFKFFNSETIRYFKALQNSLGKSPILNLDTYWEETDKEEYNINTLGEWDSTLQYNIGDVIKVTKRGKFKLIGWSSELIIGKNTSS